jgi:hypothetical protein
MRRRTFLLAVGLLAFSTGAWFDYRLRRPGPIPDCFCARLNCRIAFIADHPLFALSHPLETTEMLRTAGGFD